MLNIYPSSAPSTLRLPQIPRRRRGGQPCNRNALHHGLYAVKNRTPLTEISSTLPLYPRLLDAGSEAVSQQLILRLMEETGRAYQQLSSVADNRSMIAWFNTTVRMVALVGRMKLDYLKRFRVGSDLQVASRQAEFLIHKSFWEKGIVPEAYSFRDNICKSDFNSLALSEALCPSVSRSPFPFLTPRQWAVLEPLLPPADRSGKRGRPLPIHANCWMPFSGNSLTAPAGRTSPGFILPCSPAVATTANCTSAVASTRSTPPFPGTFPPAERSAFPPWLSRAALCSRKIRSIYVVAWKNPGKCAPPCFSSNRAAGRSTPSAAKKPADIASSILGPWASPGKKSSWPVPPLKTSYSPSPPLICPISDRTRKMRLNLACRSGKGQAGLPCTLIQANTRSSPLIWVALDQGKMKAAMKMKVTMKKDPSRSLSQ